VSVCSDYDPRSGHRSLLVAMTDFRVATNTDGKRRHQDSFQLVPQCVHAICTASVGNGRISQKLRYGFILNLVLRVCMKKCLPNIILILRRNKYYFIYTQIKLCIVSQKQVIGKKIVTSYNKILISHTKFYVFL
jgi:hypothetical protein